MKAETLSWSRGFPPAVQRIRPQDVAKVRRKGESSKIFRKNFKKSLSAGCGKAL
jgi:hypothetical protein